MDPPRVNRLLSIASIGCLLGATGAPAAQAQEAAKPNIDRLANEGVMFSDYYGEPSCTAGRANFITGMHPMRTGMTTVGQVGSPDWFMQFYAREFWRFTFVQKQFAELAKTAIEYPPMQKGASFDLEAVESQIEAAVQARHGQ